MKPLLVAESNPYQSDPRLAQRYALYPDPPHCAGWNLCHTIMQLDEAEYLRRFDRVNLCDGKWGMKEARQRARQLIGTLVHAIVLGSEPEPKPVVLFGSKVCSAFDLKFEPFTLPPAEQRVMTGMVPLVILPHPSGLSRAWSEPGAYERARAVLREAGVL
jgi:hypothetical protein